MTLETAEPQEQTDEQRRAEELELDRAIAESGFVIDGMTYPIPPLDSFDMDEGQILYDLASLSIEDFAPVPDDADDEVKIARGQELARQCKNPAFLRALMTVAYRRGNPQLPMGRIRDVVAQSNHLEAMAAFVRASVLAARKGDPRVPPAQTIEPQRSSSGNSEPSSASSGTDSGSGSVVPGDPAAAIGATRSDT